LQNHVENQDLVKGDRIPHPGYFKRLYTLEQAADYLACGLDLIEELIGARQLPVVRLGLPPKKAERGDRRKRWIDRADMDRLIMERKE
jgi:hypothetical protein